MSTPRYIMIGGFLGAGKTTAMIEFGRYLRARGLTVGIITNDQSVDLVDTARVSVAGFPVQEITGGCFCCRFDSLISVSRSLCQSTRPDVLLAEPVGSCTDLQATVGIPLRRLYGHQYHVAPFSVLIDPVRLSSLLQGGNDFDEKVNYIYRKQLEEGDILVLNKIDLLSSSEHASLVESLKSQYPQARIFEVSCRTEEGLSQWFEAILDSTPPARKTMDVDYDIYADGEALLGWLNATAQIRASSDFDGNNLLLGFAERLRADLAASGHQIAHLKMTLAPDHESHKPEIAVVSATSSSSSALLTHRLPMQLKAGTLTINLRAQADPQSLRQIVEFLLNSIPKLTVTLSNINAFRPGRPNPTHRIVVAANS